MVPGLQWEDNCKKPENWTMRFFKGYGQIECFARVCMRKGQSLPFHEIR